MTDDTVTYGTDLRVMQVGGGGSESGDCQLNCEDEGKARVREVAVLNVAAEE